MILRSLRKLFPKTGSKWNRLKSRFCNLLSRQRNKKYCLQIVTAWWLKNWSKIQFMGLSSFFVQLRTPSSTYSIKVRNLINLENKLVNIEQINYLMFWFVTANILYAMGKIVGKITKIYTLHHFGFAIGVIVLIL